MYRRGQAVPRTFPGVMFLGGDAGILPLKDESFDSVLCLDVIEHVDDPSAVACEVWRVLKKEGSAYFSTPVRGVNFLPDSERYTRFLHEHWGHKRLYSREEFISLLKGAGFTGVRTEDYMHLTTRAFLYLHYAATSLSGRVDGRLARAAERLLYGASRVDEKIRFWSAFATMAQAKK